MAATSAEIRIRRGDDLGDDRAHRRFQPPRRVQADEHRRSMARHRVVDAPLHVIGRQRVDDVVEVEPHDGGGSRRRALRGEQGSGQNQQQWEEQPEYGS
jgi:hypothetical protein